MKLALALAAILAISVPVCGQQVQPSVIDGSEIGVGAGILSGTEGVDFLPYLKRLMGDLKRNWRWVKPESVGTGKLVVFFTLQIRPDGSISDLILEDPSGEKTFDGAAIEAIHASSPFDPLPSEFHGPYVKLEPSFHYNDDQENIVLIHFKSLGVIRLAKDEPLKAMVTYTINDEQALRLAWVRQREPESFDHLGANDFDVQRSSMVGPGYKGAFNDDDFRTCVARYVLGWIGPNGRGVPFTGDPPHLINVPFDAPSPLDTCGMVVDPKP